MIVRGLALAFVVVVLLALVGGLWQHNRYLQIRRGLLGDRQPMFYSGQTFHALTFVRVAAGKSVIDEVRALQRSIEVPGGGQVVYAGQVGAAAVASKQIPSDWSGLIFAQYPSRAAYDQFSSSAAYRDGRAQFEQVYTHGVIRPAWTNLAIVQGLGLLRIFDLLRGAPSSFPFVPAGDAARPAQQAKMKEFAELDALRPITEDAVVIFNLIKPGDPEQRRADESYRRMMMSGMAEGGYGPMHIDRKSVV